MEDVAIPSLSPKYEHTPKACPSKKSWILFTKSIALSFSQSV